ncbi:hypothetical protein [Roseomonas sp. KE0001]|uniref:hypothetical protein n=1 Tax=Roseomonas sp. KE0001 TaxID=2479201 RepID=UPI0018DFF304|nr:hypothetical protein [Roseomonas sp. KE0001]MBI0435660.1 hypothetical protein [Roseomonas sp. KE0001]
MSGKAQARSTTPRRRVASAKSPAKAPRRAAGTEKAAQPAKAGRRKPAAARPPARPPGGGLRRQVADYLLGVLMLGAATWGLMSFLGVSPF